MNRTDTSLPEYFFHQGTNFHAYDYLGCHFRREESGGTPYVYVFRTWAPNASEVRLVSDFTDWSEGVPLERVSERGVWECEYRSAHSLSGSCYKFRICGENGIHLKGDPYAFASEGGDCGASRIPAEDAYEWQDAEYLEYRRRTVVRGRGKEDLPIPVNIYELHAASFARHADGSYLSYAELGDELIPYIKYMGFTHVEFMPLCEYPYDGSWGYQICAYYAPTSRFGAPEDFRRLVDRLHTAGIGVLMDWVPAHFPKDEWGLYEFDGRPLYEYQGWDRMESRSWGTRYFDLGREEVQSFLISNALYWLREYHLDGLRVDAVASMLYRDYDRASGEWTPNTYGGNQSLEAVAFLRKLNSAVHGEFPDVLMIAEESTAYPGVTAPVEEGGLGFDLKWNMGFANDFFLYLGKDPIFRRYHHAALTFPMMYAYSEHFLLPVSHDEVVYGKGSLLGKISGSMEEKREMLRAVMVFLATFPGKKMQFMGCEFGQPGEWNYRSSLDWSLLQNPAHMALREYVASLNYFYLSHPALWELDFDPAGFVWVDADRADENLISYRRRSASGEELIVVISFSGSDLPEYRLPLEGPGRYEVVFFSGDWSERYGKEFAAEEADGRYYVPLYVPARTALILARRESAVTLVLSDGKESRI